MLPRSFESISPVELRPLVPRARKRIALMANDLPGIKVAEYLRQNGDRIERLYLHAEGNRKRCDEIVAASRCPSEAVYTAESLRDPVHVASLKMLAPDFIITVYWSHLLRQDVLDAAVQGTVNFHPALLPINRGWYPHVHSIIDGTPTGVTLHAMDAKADTGPIWAQKEVPLTPYDTAYTLYQRQQLEIVALFRETWPKIASGEIQATPQQEEGAVYHKKTEVEKFDELDLDAQVSVRELVNRLRARSFGERGFAYFQEGGERVYLNLRLSPSTNFAADEEAEPKTLNSMGDIGQPHLQQHFASAKA